jgi:hypothetical protein
VICAFLICAFSNPIAVTELLGPLRHATGVAPLFHQRSPGKLPQRHLWHLINLRPLALNTTTQRKFNDYTPAQKLDAIYDLAHRLHGDVRLAPRVDGNVCFKTDRESLDDAPVVDRDIADLVELELRATQNPRNDAGPC